VKCNLLARAPPGGKAPAATVNFQRQWLQNCATGNVTVLDFLRITHIGPWHAWCFSPLRGGGNEDSMAQLAEILVEPSVIQLLVVAFSFGLATLARKA
jgi:hypothetical protein